MSWERTDKGNWLHRPWFKVVINNVLRFIQRGNPRMFLLCSVCEGNPPRLICYEFAWIGVRK